MDADRALVAAAAAGDREAFDELVRRHQTSIIGLVRSLTAGSVDAEDIAQDVFVRAWRSLGSFRGESKFRTWLHRVALNQVSSHRGRAARLRHLFQSRSADQEVDTDLVESAPELADLDRAIVLRDAIDKALGSIPEDLRIAVVLRDIQGLDYREIAEALDVPIGTVESRIFRGRQRLKPLLEPLRHGR